MMELREKIKRFFGVDILGNASEKRELWLDFCKTVAIFLVLLGHAVQYSGKSGMDNPLWTFIYSFHMPLFMFVSGIFVGKSMSLPFGRFLYKKFVQLLLPVVCWSVVYLIFIHGGISLYFELVNVFEPYLWFLKVLFLCHLAMFLLMKLSSSSVWTGVLVAIIVMLPVGEYEYSLFGFMLPFFFCGYLFGKYKTVLVDNLYKVLFISLPVFIALFVGWKYRYTIYYSNSPLVSLSPFAFDFDAAFIYLYRFVLGLSGTVAAVLLCKLLYDRFKNARCMPYLLSIGKCTLGIYVLQTYAMDYYLFRMKPGFSFWETCVYSIPIAVSVLLCCWIVVCCLDSNRWTRLLFLGKKV